MAFKSVRLCLALVAGVPSVLSAQSKFEGVITISLASPRGSAEMSYLVKNDRVRIDMSMGPGGKAYMLRDPAKNVSAMVMPEQRMYMNMQGMEAAVAGRANQSKADIKPTGKTETIAGYQCEHVIISDDGAQYDVCGAKGIGAFHMGNGPMGGRGAAGGPPAGLSRLGADFFPLKVQKVGGEVAMQVTKIEKKSLDESLFTIPSDYQKMDMPMRGRPPF